MGGGWTGYVFVFAGCGLVLFIAGIATAILYALTKIRGRGPQLRVVDVGTSSERQSADDA